MFFKLVTAALFVTIVASFVIGMNRSDGEASASDAERAARDWVGAGTVQPARLEDDEWEVDVLRPNGSLVEVTLDLRLKLVDVDEELGPDGTWAHDEVRGPLRHEAILAAFKVTPPGRVTSVERDSADEIEVNIRRGGTLTEVELDGKLRPGEVEQEDPGDE